MSLHEHKPNKILLFWVLFLIVSGLLILTSASLVKSQETFGENYYYLKHQFLFGVLLGSLCFLLALRINYAFWRKIAIFIFFISLVLSFLLFLPQFGLKLGGARQWIGLGGQTFQPSEFVKIGFVIYVSAWLSKRSRDINSFNKTIFPFIFLNLLIGVLFLAQRDMGGLLITYIYSGLLLFLSGLNYRRFFALIAIALVVVIPLIIFSSYRLPRIKSFLQPDRDPLGSSYQIRQSLIGIGSGGVFGKGYGQSLQKTGYLPEVLGDSTFAVLVEELGLIGGSILVLSFLFFAFLGFRIAKRAPDDFAKLCAAGITVMITWQAFINIGAISGLIPLTGLTLPLVSYGSSSYIITLFSLGILANISKHTKTKNI